MAIALADLRKPRNEQTSEKASVDHGWPVVVVRVVFCTRLPLGFALAAYPPRGSALFFLLHGLFYINLALDSVVWWDVFGKAIPAPQRGQLLGLSTALRGILSVGAGYLIARLLAENGPSFPFNYAVIFALSGFSLLFSMTL